MPGVMSPFSRGCFFTCVDGLARGSTHNIGMSPATTAYDAELSCWSRELNPSQFQTASCLNLALSMIRSRSFTVFMPVPLLLLLA